MNNFAKNEATVRKIKIYNSDEDNFLPSATVNLESIDIQYFPERDVFLNGISNTMAIQIANCYGNVPKIYNAKVVDQAGNEVTIFFINHWISDVLSDKDGNFKFKIPLMNQQEVKIVIQGFAVEGRIINSEQIVTLKTL